MHKGRLNRLVALDDFIRNSDGKSFQEIWDFCKLHGKNIQSRMVREDLKLLKLGSHKQDIPVNLVLEKGKYRINTTGHNWSYSDLEENERNTLPFVFSLLEPYKNLPSVKRVLNDLLDAHKLDNNKIKKESAKLSIKPMPENKAFADLIAKMMGLIAEQKACEFNYFKVSDYSSYSSKDAQPDLVELFPLQIRVYNSRYYLIGIRIIAEWKPKRLQIFAMDRIFQYKVNVCYDQETEEELRFDWNKLSQAIGLNTYFKNCIGVFRNFDIHTEPKSVYRWFRGWAASHIEAVPLHESQEIIQRRGNEIRVRWKIFETFELNNILCKYGTDCWEE